MKAKIHIHIIAYNEEIMLPFTVAHYKRMFGDPHIVVHDNYSTDKTVQIATELGCTVIPFRTEGMNDTVQSQMKNVAAMSESITEACDWVLCIDCDEECLINTADLDELEKRGVNVVQFEGWNIFDQVNSPWDIKLPMGIQDGGYSKPVLIRTGVFDDIRFAAGAHSVILRPKEGMKENRSVSEFKLLHYKHWSCEWNIKRSAELAARQSEDNKAKGHSFHFRFPRETHENFFKTHYGNRRAIVDPRINYPDGVNCINYPDGSKHWIITGTKGDLNG